MAVIILKRHGIDSMEPVARWEDGEFVEGDQAFTQDPVYQHYDVEMLMDEFDGPDLFAIPESDYTGGDDQ